MELWGEGGWESSRVATPSHTGQPQLKLPIKDNRYCTFEGKGLFQAIFYLFSLLEPKDPAHTLLELRPLHPSLAYICQTAVLGAVA